MTEVLLGDGPLIEELREDVGLAARCDVPILITGDAGFRKAALARLVHASSGRPDGDLSIVNCATASEGDLATALATPGTLFLARLDRLSPPLQNCLMRFIECRPEDAPRLISAADDTLFELVRTGRFREDLFYRLNILHLRIPCLPMQAHTVTTERCVDL